MELCEQMEATFFLLINGLDSGCGNGLIHDNFQTGAKPGTALQTP